MQIIIFLLNLIFILVIYKKYFHFKWIFLGILPNLFLFFSNCYSLLFVSFYGLFLYLFFLFKNKKYLLGCSFFLVYCFLMVFILSAFVKQEMKGSILDDDYPKVDAILVLGAKAYPDRPSPILKDRLDKAVEIYKLGVALKIIVSGDHGTKSYDEVNVMKEYLINSGVKSEDIFMDHAGFSTYDSVVRAQKIFGVKSMVIVTQKYHLYRALYIAREFNIDSFGVSSDIHHYEGALGRELREVLARDKDVLKCFFKPKPKYLGDIVPVSGNGDLTNDK